MPLPAGTRLGPYEILVPLGAGGMGEVYRARDPKLKRDVAIKVLPADFTADPGRMMRFQREAEVLASLDHPNIGAIHGMVDSEGTQGLVLALVEGPTLAERLVSGPLSQEEAIAVAQQIIAALEYAHDRGVIHRDLKPANVKVTPEGVVKVLDFGLAKVLEDDQPPASAANSPTLTLGHTRAGVILGTAAYMSPEQAHGKTVDRRSDIFSFGAVFYEMLTGQQAFRGESVGDTLAAVLKLEPDWDKLPKSTPAAIRKLVWRCLIKDCKQRLQAIGEARIVLEKGSSQAGDAAPALLPRKRFRWLWPVIAALLLAAFAAIAVVHYREEPPRVVRLFFPPPENGSFATQAATMAVSPDGRRIAFQALVGEKTGLWVRDLDAPTARLLAVVSDASPPFWAPDSRRLGFSDGGKLKKIDVAGGPAVTIANGVAPFLSGAWNQYDVIIFGGANGALFRVSAGGGSITPVTELDPATGERIHALPWFLPDGRHFLFGTTSGRRGENGHLYIGDLSSKGRRELAGISRGIYVAPGFLLFFRDRTLLAQPFDAVKLAATGDAVPVAEDVLDPFNGVGYFSASQNGVLAFMNGAGDSGSLQLTWFDRAGKKLGTVGARGDLGAFALSPDGTSVVLARRDTQNSNFDLWRHHFAGGAESRLTFAGNNQFPVWSSDGTRIFFMSDRDGGTKIYQKAANGAGPEEVVDTSYKLPQDASRDGRYLVADTSNRNAKGSDIWVLPLTGDRKPFPYVQTEFSQLRGRLSPDGRWLAYQSNESKRYEVYVVSFPQPGGKWQISTSGGRDTVWSRDGRELFYYANEGKIMASQVASGAQFSFSAPKALFDMRIGTTLGSFDVSKDGRFLLPALLEQDALAPMTVVLNWPQVLKSK